MSKKLSLIVTSNTLILRIIAETFLKHKMSAIKLHQRHRHSPAGWHW